MPVLPSKIRVDKQLHQLAITFVLVGAVAAIGTTGYMLIEDWSFLESLYMTVITVSTVGYKEEHPLSAAGQVFTIVLIIMGVGVALYSISLIMAEIVEGELLKFRGFIKMNKEIGKLSGHTIICGFGRLASIVTRGLADAGKEVVVVDNDPARIVKVGEANYLYVEGNASDDETLKKAGIERAEAILALLPTDAENIYVVLSARDLNSKIKIIARTEDDSGEKKILRAGANQVIFPYKDSGVRRIQQMTQPHVSNFLEIATKKSESGLIVEEVSVAEGSTLIGKTLASSDIRHQTGVHIAALIHPNGEMTLNPGASEEIKKGMKLIVLGEEKSIKRLGEHL
jgi:voltage-gated potassium channel